MGACSFLPGQMHDCGAVRCWGHARLVVHTRAQPITALRGRVTSAFTGLQREQSSRARFIVVCRPYSRSSFGTMSTSSDPFFTTTDGMTAVFTPPTSCSTMWTYEPQSANSIPGGILMQNAVYESVSKNTDCYPSGYAQWGRAPSFMQVFSPGACPHGYATVGQFDGHAEQATTAICCPR